MDLIIYSNLCTDSKASIEKILQVAEKNNLKVISITDRNTAIAHIAVKQMNISKFYSGIIIPGAEFDVSYNETTLKILAYNFNVEQIQQWAYNNYEAVSTRQEKMYNCLIKKCKDMGLMIDPNMQWNSKREFAHEFILRNIKSNFNNRKIFQKFMPKNNIEFYNLITTNPNYPLYVNINTLYPSIDELNKIIHSYLGKTFLAEPFSYNLNLNDLLKIIKEKRIDGVEVYSPDHTEEQTNLLLNFCKENKLLITGGSKFNNTKKYKHMVNLTNKLFI